jgi:hypothetical protein
VPVNAIAYNPNQPCHSQRLRKIMARLRYGQMRLWLFR